MSSKIKVMVVVSLTVIALAGISISALRGNEVFRMVASAVWGA
jgi:hypothetical protein